MIGEDVMAPNTTETDQLREQLLRAQRLSSVGTLASSVAHEFNNILTTIINYNYDVSDFWQWSDSNTFAPIDETNEAYKFGVNYIMYALTH